MNRMLTSVTALAIAGLSISTAMAGKTVKAVNDNTKETERAPQIQVLQKQTVDEASGEIIHVVTVNVTNGGSGSLLAIYKHPNGSRYSAKLETFGGTQEKKAKGKGGKKEPEKKKANNKEPDKKKAGDQKDAEKKSSKSYTFPHTDGEGKFVDCVAIIRKGDKIVSKYSSNSVWLSCLDKLFENSASLFNSRGELVEEGGTADAAPSEDKLKQAASMRQFQENQRRNKELMDKANNNTPEQ